MTATLVSVAAADAAVCDDLLAKGRSLKQQESYYLQRSDKWFKKSIALDRYSDAEREQFSALWEQEIDAAYAVLAEIVILSGEYAEKGCDELRWFNEIDSADMD